MALYLISLAYFIYYSEKQLFKINVKSIIKIKRKLYIYLIQW
jgi:hypothetical protein